MDWGDILQVELTRFAGELDVIFNNGVSSVQTRCYKENSSAEVRHKPKLRPFSHVAYVMYSVKHTINFCSVNKSDYLTSLGLRWGKSQNPVRTLTELTLQDNKCNIDLEKPPCDSALLNP